MEDPIYASQDHAGFPALTGPEGQLDFRPHSPTTDQDLSSTSAALVHIPDELSEHDEAGSLRGSGYYDEPSFYDHGYNSSASSTEHSSASGVLAHYFEDDETQPQRNSRTSSHSSVSSIPASVLVHPHDSSGKSLARRRDPRDSDGYWADHGSASLKKSRSNRHREGPFRKPSSVRAIQMHTEDESDGYSTPSRRRGGATHHRLSGFSTRSAGSSPLKRSHMQSPSKSASKKGVKSEYPLVLLHCTLLPPSLSVAGFTGRPDQKILKDVLPRKYWRRWKVLEEKVGSGYLRDRGVLISHPEDSYDLLEEKLLESLELQRPRLQHGHFLAQEDEHESENEDMDREESVSDDDDEQGDLCPDCGGRVATCDSQNRKWEVKVFAANGLMRAGAWAAAWKEMEKVDVEVSLWLPTDVRRELERRLLDETASREETAVHEDASSKNNPVDNTGVPVSPKQSVFATPTQASQGPTHEKAPPTQDQKPDAQIDLLTLLVNYFRVLANDKRNIVIALLSIAIAFFAVSSARPSPSVPEVQTVPEESVASASLSAASVSQYAAASARPSTVQTTDDALESAGIANSVPASVVSAADITAAGEQETASPEVEDAAADVSEMSGISISTTTVTLLEVPTESMSADDMSTEQPDAPAPTEYATVAADPEIARDPLESSGSPVDSPIDPESDNLVDLDAAQPDRENSIPTDEATEPDIEESTLEE